ncbi:MAG TPA: ABC transporter permease [Solirubrobacterales bacterium]|jgi:ribose transport system permease protein|nr:ABC transporter permease [Solirubrobacterales bacterium]
MKTESKSRRKTEDGTPVAPAVATSGSANATLPASSGRHDVPLARRILAGIGPRRISAVYLFILFVVVFTLINPNTFLTSATFRLVFSEGVVTCLLALAFLVPLAAGAYDLSIGNLMALSLGLCVWLNLHTGLPASVAALLAILACTAVGAFSGFVVVKLRVNSFIATLGTSQILLAMVLLLSGNSQLIAEFPDSYKKLGTDQVAGIPIVVFYLLGVSILLWFVLEHTPVGRYLFATGGNEQAARLTGVRTDRVVWGSLIASGAICGLAGVVYSMRTGIFSSTTGPGYLFPAVAAVFLGASQFQQRPNVWGTLIAYFALAFGIQGLALSSTSGAVWSQPLFEGVALIVAVSLASRPIVAKLREARADKDLEAIEPDAPPAKAPAGSG